MVYGGSDLTMGHGASARIRHSRCRCPLPQPSRRLVTGIRKSVHRRCYVWLDHIRVLVHVLIFLLRVIVIFEGMIVLSGLEVGHQVTLLALLALERYQLDVEEAVHVERAVASGTSARTRYTISCDPGR